MKIRTIIYLFSLCLLLAFSQNAFAATKKADKEATKTKNTQSDKVAQKSAKVKELQKQLDTLNKKLKEKKSAKSQKLQEQLASLQEEVKIKKLQLKIKKANEELQAIEPAKKEEAAKKTSKHKIALGFRFPVVNKLNNDIGEQQGREKGVTIDLLFPTANVVLSVSYVHTKLEYKDTNKLVKLLANGAYFDDHATINIKNKGDLHLAALHLGYMGNPWSDNRFKILISGAFGVARLLGYRLRTTFDQYSVPNIYSFSDTGFIQGDVGMAYQIFDLMALNISYQIAYTRFTIQRGNKDSNYDYEAEELPGNVLPLLDQRLSLGTTIIF